MLSLLNSAFHNNSKIHYDSTQHNADTCGKQQKKIVHNNHKKNMSRIASHGGKFNFAWKLYVLGGLKIETKQQTKKGKQRK